MIGDNNNGTRGTEIPPSVVIRNTHVRIISNHGLISCQVCFKRCELVKLDPDTLVEFAGSFYIVEVYKHLDGTPDCVEAVPAL